MFIFDRSRIAIQPTMLLVCITVLTDTECQGQLPTTVVSPSEFASAEADGLADLPLPVNWRWMQIYDRSEFHSFGNESLQITRVAARPEGTFTDDRWVYMADNLTLRMSVTEIAPNTGGMSTTYDENFTSPPVVVFEGPFVFRTENVGPDGGPKEFDMVVNLDEPFPYDPARGNLLLDWVVTNGSGGRGGTTAVDFTNPISSIETVWSGSQDFQAPVGSEPHFGGIITQFTFEPVPEPSGIHLCLLSSAILLYLTRTGGRSWPEPDGESP